MIYLDHNASSPLRASARDAMMRAMGESGNPSSVHGAGRRARALVESARESVAKVSGTQPGNVVFTSGGTEANALALRGCIAGGLAAEDRITRLFISAIEHDSIRLLANDLENSVPGLKVQTIAVDADGVVDLDAFRMQLMQGKGRALVCVMAANNETGVIQPIDQIVKLIRADGGRNSIVHVDAVQAAGRMTLNFDASDVDTMSLSAHKIGGPQGAGALLLKEGVPFMPLFPGHQEMARRAGTENVAALGGFGAALREAADFRSDNARLAALRDLFESQITSLRGAVIFGAKSPRLANTSNFAIPGISAETALIALDLDGIALSSGAACASGKVRASHVLGAMNIGEDLARSALRLSLGWSSKDSDIDAALAGLKKLAARANSKAA